MMIKLSDDLTLSIGKNKYSLTKSEYLILQVLMKNRGKILTLQEICAETGGNLDYVRIVIQKFRKEFGLKIPRVSGYVFREEDN